MRPSDITDGIPGTGYFIAPRTCCFNEAVGYYRRNRHDGVVRQERRHLASMRPSDITDGILPAGRPLYPYSAQLQ